MFAHRLSLLAGPYSPLASGGKCLTASLYECLAFGGIPPDVCALVAAGEPFDEYEVRAAITLVLLNTRGTEPRRRPEEWVAVPWGE